MVKTMRNSECGMRNSKVRSWRTRLALLFRIPHSTFHIEGKPHARLLPHEPPHLKRREGREDRARVGARGRDQLVYVPRLGGEHVPQRPFERLEIGGPGQQARVPPGVQPERRGRNVTSEEHPPGRQERWHLLPPPDLVETER